MRKDRILSESKNYLISVHDILRKTFRNAPSQETVFIASVLEGIEKDVKQLEALEEMMTIWNLKEKHKIMETEE